MAYLLILLLSLFFLIRTTLMFIGLLKGPIITLFEQYGGQEKLFLPLLPLVGWTGGLLIGLGGWAVSSPEAQAALAGLGVVLVLATYLAYQDLPLITEFHVNYLPYPRWYHELLERTTRYERRRIAYMWLRLSWRTRLMYNSNSQVFLIWADFIIMGTVMEDDSTDHPGNRGA
ncbi:MAG: hypothetical protein H6672_18245 [Anaerolineaceae bacterium]|nr:hypothetical protein [Anaerolineaceae bacterium]